MSSSKRTTREEWLRNKPPRRRMSSAEARQVMAEYWKEHSQAASVEEMMLDDNAAAITEMESAEIIGMLPDMSGKSVLELGAGIGRFTGTLADPKQTAARRVCAVDFIEKFLEKNKEQHGHLANIEYKQADVVKLDLPADSYDIVFSNWLFMYLTDAECEEVFHKIITWLHEGGTFYLRESCFYQSGSKSRTENPTQYRHPATYNTLLDTVVEDIPGSNEVFGFHVEFCRPVETYIKCKDNPNQLCWLLKKTRQLKDSANGFRTMQAFLDAEHSEETILQYERVFGRHFVSPGGRQSAERLIKKLELSPDQMVLDVGCGLGGSAFLMAERYEVSPIGIDLSTNMISIAMERLNEVVNSRHRPIFEVYDAMTYHYRKQYFDAILSREVIIHIKEKAKLFQHFYRTLKPGGRLLVTDYCCRDEPESEWSSEYKNFIKSHGYHPVSKSRYSQVLESVGFNLLSHEDETEWFLQLTTKELNQLRDNREELLKDFSTDGVDELTKMWETKLQFIKSGDNRWGVFLAQKPFQS